MKRLLGLAFVLLAPAAACSEDPQYVPGPSSIEVGVDGTDMFTGTVTVDLPFELESMKDAEKRNDLAMSLGIAPDQLAYVRVGDVDVSLEWSIKNLTENEGTARISINGGNQFWYYVPLNFVVDPEEDEEPPPLLGDIPLLVGGNGERSGVFREDQIREASVDLEQITRAMVNPFAAMLTINEDDPGVTIPPVMVPHDDLSQLVRFDITFEADRHMVLEYGLRVRDHRGILHPEGLAAPPEELTVFAPMEFVPPAPVE
jgi:hypothetical protein